MLLGNGRIVVTFPGRDRLDLSLPEQPATTSEVLVRLRKLLLECQAYPLLIHCYDLDRVITALAAVEEYLILTFGFVGLPWRKVLKSLEALPADDRILFENGVMYGSRVRLRLRWRRMNHTIRGTIRLNIALDN